MTSSPHERPRIVDSVFLEARESKTLPAVFLGIAVALLLHGAFALIARFPDHTLEVWSEEMSQYVHDHVVVVERVAYRPPPPAPPSMEPPREAVRPRAAAHTSMSNSPSAPAAPVTASAATSPIDFGDFAIDEASGQSNLSPGSGGGTPGGGTSTGIEHAAPRAPATDRSSAVGLVDEDWNCPWPEDADDAAIDLQTTVVRVVVRADGSAESARAVSGAEHGFGNAAVSCAMLRRYAPARDAAGVPMRRESGPIRITFTRGEL